MGNCNPNNKKYDSIKESKDGKVKSNLPPEPIWTFKDGKHHNKNGNTWTGEIKNDNPEGEGVYQFKDGEKYEGKMINGNFEGKGIFYHKDQGRYEGEYKNDKRHGKGVFYFPSGDRFEGEYKDAQRNGKGIYYYVNGAKFEGEFANGEKNGKGIYYYVNGAKFEGEYKNNEMHGFGVYTSSTHTFEGMYLNNLRHGYGKLIILNPLTKKFIGAYEGEYRNGKYNGEGLHKIYREDESIEICRGTFKDGKRHGFCKVELIENNEKRIFYEGFYHEGYPIPPK